jgi:glyoxylase-like metal-dependent hydrolase (beta-lactamase superfamily II)
MSTDKARVDILLECFYLSFGVYKGHPMLTFRWPLTPMPPQEIAETYKDYTFNFGSTNTVLIRDEGKNVLIDPGILQLGRYGLLPKRLAEFNLKLEDIDIIINTHCHYDHIEANYLWRGKPLLIHEKEYEYAVESYWPEWRNAFIDIMDVQKFTGEKKLTKNIRIIETAGHTPGSISALVETPEGLVACIGDAAIVKEDYLEFREPSVVTKNINGATAVESLKKIASYKPVLVIPGHDTAFRTQKT